MVVRPMSCLLLLPAVDGGLALRPFMPCCVGRVTSLSDRLAMDLPNWPERSRGRPSENISEAH